jgi:phosphate transport system substrate-binding protein
MKETPRTMTALRIGWIACCLFALPLAAGSISRIYVEPFTTKAGPEKLRDGVISELRKLGSVSIVSSAAQADAILGGGGEIWIKGYRSLNPRSGRSPSDGTPLYSGYLSVELKNSAGETLWSDLVTPAVASEDVAKDLSKRIAKHVARALEQGVSPPQAAPPSVPAAILKGAGATFPYPVYNKWFTNYRRENPSVDITYSAIGSEAGIRSLLDGQVDFGASDSPQAIREIEPDAQAKYVFLPSVVGAVVPIVNLPGFAGDIAFTPEALAGIYLGKIKKWNDPALKQANKGLHLPDLDIVVVHRQDGSGTSYAWTDYLSKTSPEWKLAVGSSLTPGWPTGRAAEGNDGVANLVKELGGAIGYVEFIYALENHLNYGKVRNQNGEFVGASLESISAAVTHCVEMCEGLKISVIDSPGSGAYPIASFTWLVVPAHIADPVKRSALVGFLKWMLGPGQTQAAALGYLALPADVVAKEQAALAKL